MSINPDKCGKCWSCKYCEDIGTFQYEDYVSYMRKCKKFGREYEADCANYCSDYEWDGKTTSGSGAEAAKAAASASSASSGSASSSSTDYASSSGSGHGCANAIAIAVLVMMVAIMIVASLSFSPESLFEPTTTATVTESLRQTAVVYNVKKAVNMRQKPDTDSERITTIPKGEVVEIIEKSGKWYLVKYQDQEGYCYEKYLDIQD